jgi:subtilisin family serine protease
VAVRANANFPRSELAKTFSDAGAAPLSSAITIASENLLLIRRRPEITFSPADAMKTAAPVEAVFPVFDVNGDKAIVVDRLVIGFEDGADRDGVARDHSLTLVRSAETYAIFKMPPASRFNDLAAQIERAPGVRYVEPDFVLLTSLSPLRASLKSPPTEIAAPSGQYAAEITKADRVWSRMQGDRAIRIAVLDLGVDTRHPDLRGGVTATYDATDGDSYQEPHFFDSHGTNCAGLACAFPAAEGGMRGIGGGCALLAVRIGTGVEGTSYMNTSPSIQADGVRWARMRGADIISCSWGGRAPANVLTDEIDEAAAAGRNGKGCVILFAAGNAGQPVSYPANLSAVICVSASNQFDEAKTFHSRDNERWSSNYGREVTLAAPGVENRTTDNVGGDGASPSDYYDVFNGTSSSTPIVAGACGLILSVNPDLTAADVRNILQQTADKVGQFPYTGSRNDRMGYGRLNVEAAVDEARRRAAPAPFA